MDRWHRKYLGLGPQVYQSLSKLRGFRFSLDPDVTEDRLFVVASDTVTLDTFVYLPPGNSVMVTACDAVPCSAPNFQDGSLFKLLVERYPIIAALPSDALTELDFDDF